ncbi:hypothetical protein KP509_15G041300 [Ceratopteris richardii]|uniref:Peptidase A1 domain-containing protein n=1 Tax=Ceratopteris richardii TaxID=49495 RepID=A0A8T2T6F3_CERRI|nr:hypothetical protein KP509_15G041300 [Ceratopteris richardii]
MASSTAQQLLRLLLLSAFAFCIAAAATSFRPKALLSPISFDASTSLYSISLGNKYSLLLDLENSVFWIDCVHPPYSSSTMSLARCHGAVCNMASVCNSLICDGGGAPGCATCFGPPSPVCQNSSCSPSISNSAISTSTVSTLWTDTFSVLSTDGRNPGPIVDVPKLPFACADDLLITNNSVPAGVVGDAALSRAKIALPSQLAAKLSLKRKFTYCLPSTSSGKGVLFFGDSPIVFLPSIDFSNNFKYTPLLTDPSQPDSYMIGITGISVNGVKLKIDSDLLKIKNDGTGSTIGGTIITSTERYTQLESSIYDALAREFKAAANARGIKDAPAVSPFDTCFDASTASSTRIGYNVPEIDLSLKGSGGVVWPIFGANSVVSVQDDKVICLAFLRRKQYETRAVVIGTFQQQDALMQFDLATSRLGFVPTLLGRMATCSNFNFTSV